MTGEIARPWLQPGRWRVASWNYASGVRGGLAPAGEARVFVVDSTIRSIVTSEAGSAPSVQDLVDVARALADAGVSETVFNVVHGGEPSDLTIEAARRIRAESVPIRTSTEMHVGPDNWRQLLDFGISLDLDCVQWAYGAGGRVEGYTGSPAAMDLMEQSVAYMVERGQATALAYNVMYDDDPDYIIAFFKRAAVLPMQSLRLYDTTTSMSPDAMRWLVGAIKHALPADAPPLVVHTHNAWGLASACTIAAVLGGADGVDVVVNGLGTKGGHTPMAETLIALEGLYGVRTGVNLQKLTALSQLVADRIGVALPRVMPAVGPDFFLVEQAGLVLQAYKERDSGNEYDVPWAPSVAGQQRKIVWGRNTLKTPVISYLLRKLNVEPTPDKVEWARQTISGALAGITSYPIWLEEQEVLQLLRQPQAVSV
jgi:hypothetical protein